VAVKHRTHDDGARRLGASDAVRSTGDMGNALAWKVLRAAQRLLRKAGGLCAILGDPNATSARRRALGIGATECGTGATCACQGSQSLRPEYVSSLSSTRTERIVMRLGSILFS